MQQVDSLKDAIPSVVTKFPAFMKYEEIIVFFSEKKSYSSSSLRKLVYNL